MVGDVFARYLDIIDGATAWGRQWLDYYACDPQNFPGTAEQKALVIGGHGAIWGEACDAFNLLPRIWPRLAATAERLWTPQVRACVLLCVRGSACKLASCVPGRHCCCQRARGCIGTADESRLGLLMRKCLNARQMRRHWRRTRQTLRDGFTPTDAVCCVEASPRLQWAHSAIQQCLRSCQSAQARGPTAKKTFCGLTPLHDD